MKKGSSVKGEITAIKPYGAFVKVGNEYDGLIHISEFSDGFVRSIDDYVSVGDIIELKVISVNNNKLSLSFKELHKRKKRYNITLKEGFSPLKKELVQWLNDYKFESDE
ncbi:General stress protein 13 [Candidatus Izimaplasma bacterium HR1]|jgi:general stress protein 13|uniref:S1 RNA-binding domain-containing protein n=1 Tax=Candidatus Izimoplasma sp. HR1 TaxID=1541959 RepID=UPI0004F62934|nr:General stress protein 13 [Candidatus Izimaplasma bacterium HR1]